MASRSVVFGITVFGLVVFASVCPGGPPVPVSPGKLDEVVQSAVRCPTFSWSLVPQAVGYQLVVYRVPEDRQAEPEVVIQQDLPGGTSSWTPGAPQCLAAGQTYAWRVGAVPVEGEAAWSEPLWFGVSGESVVVSESLVDQVAERLLLRRQEQEEATGGGAGGVRPASKVPTPTIRVRALNGSGVAFSVGSTGNVVGGAFFGDGFNLTNLSASNLGTGTVPDGVLSGTYSNALSFSNASNSFVGNGSGLTNLNPASIAAGTAGINITGTASNVTGPNPLQIAMLMWYIAANIPAHFTAGGDLNHPEGVAFDGAHIWVANADGNSVTELNASDGSKVGTFTAGGDIYSPIALAFDGAHIWVANLGNSLDKL
jgi:hypothetical protein